MNTESERHWQSKVIGWFEGGEAKKIQNLPNSFICVSV